MEQKPETVTTKKRIAIKQTMKRALIRSKGKPTLALTQEAWKILNIMHKMAVVHEIALNPYFKLELRNGFSTFGTDHIKQYFGNRYWDAMREELQRATPSYRKAFEVLTDIKAMFPRVLCKKNHLMEEEVNNVLDYNLIQQQVEKQTLDWQQYANYIILRLSNVCTPSHREALKKLKELVDPVETFRGIIRTMILMRVDIVNFIIHNMRKSLVSSFVVYEKRKLKQLEHHRCEFPATEIWLNRNRTQHATNLPLTINQILTKAYMELMDWNEAYSFPELLYVDKNRILRLGQRGNRICICATAITLCCAVPILKHHTDARQRLAKEIAIILKDIQLVNETKLSEAMQNIWLQAVLVINNILQEAGQRNLDANSEHAVKTLIDQTHIMDSRVRSLMWNRLKYYMQLVLRSNNGFPAPPLGYADYKLELESYATELKRIIVYNHSVFGEYFSNFLRQTQSETMPVEEQEDFLVLQNEKLASEEKPESQH